VRKKNAGQTDVFGSEKGRRGSVIVVNWLGGGRLTLKRRAYCVPFRRDSTTQGEKEII